LVSNTQLWAGRIVSGFAVLFFLMDGVMKLMKPDVVVKATVQELGYPESEIVGIGVLLLACTLLYVIPRTSILGAILLTGYLGGAIASKIRIGGPWSGIAFTVAFACLVWGGLWLRDVRVRSLI
jgi:DoxX-like family